METKKYMKLSTETDLAFVIRLDTFSMCKIFEPHGL